MPNEEVMHYLELLANHFDRQVLVTKDLETIDIDVTPWLDNIVVDEQGSFAIPNSLMDMLK
tara:strand:- start:328 stop:510 length:183 start_codon:yes stop_codon:yes gene_type:complete